jgi:hypothetical protein
LRHEIMKQVLPVDQAINIDQKQLDAFAAEASASAVNLKVVTK